MAPTDEILKRDYPCGYGEYLDRGVCRSYGAWYWWGRWVFAAVVVLFVIFVLVVLGCISSRRRRRRGLQPMYGTGWMTNGKYGPQGANGHEMYPPNNYAAPPAYQAQPQHSQYTGSTFSPSDGYYGQQHQGVQYPSQTYQRDQVYEPPTGPPPAKH